MIEKQVYRKDNKQPSEMFLRSMSEMGCENDEIECGWCGRLHLAPDTVWRGNDDDELNNYWYEYCESKYKKNPDGVILHYNTDGIYSREFNNYS